MRVLPLALVLVAALADRSAEPRLAFYALVAAVPAVAAATLAAVADKVELRRGPEHVVFWSCVLGLVIVGAALRAPVVAEGSTPALARSALLGSLALFVIHAVAGVFAELRTRRLF
jgi:cyanate permease